MYFGVRCLIFGRRFFLHWRVGARAGHAAAVNPTRSHLRMQRLLAVAVFMVLMCGTWTGLLAASLADGIAAHQRGDYETALGIFRPLAEQNNVAAQYNLAHMYREGQGVLQDFDGAARLYRMAAEQGDGLSQYNLGAMYYNGQGAPRNLVLSYMWLTVSAVAGAENAARSRAILTRQMSSEQIAEALRLVRDCQKQNFKNCD